MFRKDNPKEYKLPVLNIKAPMPKCKSPKEEHVKENVGYDPVETIEELEEMNRYLQSQNQLFKLDNQEEIIARLEDRIRELEEKVDCLERLLSLFEENDYQDDVI